MGWFCAAAPQQLKLCPGVTEVAGIVFPANSLFQGLQIRVYNDLGGPERGLPLLADFGGLGFEEASGMEMTSSDETPLPLQESINSSPQSNPPTAPPRPRPL